MSGRDTRKRRKAPAKRATVARRPVVKPALGNDPFESGAAVREPPPALELADVSGPAPAVDAVEAQPAASPVATPPAIPEPADAAGAPPAPPVQPVVPPLDARGPAHGAGTGTRARDVVQAVSRLAPGLREKLGQLVSLARILERPGELDSFGMDRELAARAAPLFDFLYSTWWRVEVRHIDHVPAEGPVIVIANHGGALPWDALVLRLALAREHAAGRDLRPLLDDAVMKAPILGFLAARLGAVAATPEGALDILGGGGLVGYFPEGTAGGARPWTQRYRVWQFGRGGFAKVAIRAGAAIVPCAVVGSEETSAPPARSGWLAESLGVPLLAPALRVPLGPIGLLPLPARWSLRFGEPITTGAQGPDDAADEGRVFDLTERTRSALQRMLDEDVAARRSVYI
jgi:1-acyl-sn-glycerol-3-phosphate acyltransferase